MAPVPARRRSTELDYVTRVNRVIDHVHDHLAAPAALRDLARVACFSPFHCHRVFRTVTGETLRAFVARARVERAALVLGRAGSRMHLSDLAADLGFSSQAELSRAFRARFGETPSAYRRRPSMRKNPQAERKRRVHPQGHDRPARSLAVHVTTVPERHVAYVRITNPFAEGKLAAARAALLAWAARRGPAEPVLLGISHDDPDVTPLDRCRYDLACEVPAGARGAGEVSVRRLGAGRYAELEARGDVAAIAAVWDRLFAEWLPASGYDPGDGPGIERWLEPPDFSSSVLRAVLALPVVRARR